MLSAFVAQALFKRLKAYGSKAFPRPYQLEMFVVLVVGDYFKDKGTAKLDTFY